MNPWSLQHKLLPCVFGRVLVLVLGLHAALRRVASVRCSRRRGTQALAAVHSTRRPSLCVLGPGSWQKPPGCGTWWEGRWRPAASPDEGRRARSSSAAPSFGWRFLAIGDRKQRKFVLESGIFYFFLHSTFITSEAKQQLSSFGTAAWGSIVFRRLWPGQTSAPKWGLESDDDIRRWWWWLRQHAADCKTLVLDQYVTRLCFRPCTHTQSRATARSKCLLSVSSDWTFQET